MDLGKEELARATSFLERQHGLLIDGRLCTPAEGEFQRSFIIDNGPVQRFPWNRGHLPVARPARRAEPSGGIRSSGDRRGFTVPIL